VAERSAQGQVLRQMLGERAHREAPGQGWATWRSRPKSIFA
jgi:hypothetical protein